MWVRELGVEVCLSGTTAAGLASSMGRCLVSVLSSFNGPDSLCDVSRGPGRVVLGTERSITGFVGTSSGSVCFAKNKSTDGALTVGKCCRGGSYAVFCSPVTRGSVLGYMKSCRGGVPLGTGGRNFVSVRSLRGCLSIYVGAPLIMVSRTGSRVKAVRGVRRVVGVARLRGNVICLSYAKDVPAVPVSMGGLSVSVVNFDKRGVRTLGNYNILCGGGSVRLRPLVCNDRRGKLYTNARGILKVTDLNGTIRRCRCSSVSSTGESCICSCVAGGVPSDCLINTSVRSKGQLPRGLFVYFGKVRNRDLVVLLSVGKVYMSIKDTYSDNRLSPDPALITVNVSRRSVRSYVEVSFSNGRARRRLSRMYEALGRYIRDLEGFNVWRMLRGRVV